MTTTHEFDAYCDTQDFAEPDYHEQCLVMQDFAEYAENEHRRLGAIDALEDVKYQMVSQKIGTSKDPIVTFWYFEVLRMINRRLESLQETGGVA